jgi:16S rRNA (cytidine1402-2'-O)-methyltransferase
MQFHKKNNANAKYINAGPAIYIVSTPIGNLDDLTYRAHNVLKSVDGILAENPRHSSRLLSDFGIVTPMRQYHDHNEKKITEKILDEVVEKDLVIALISDAGTPLISDPGYTLVQQAGLRHIPIFPVPGACALIAALSISGLPTNRFVFEGFLPSNESARNSRLDGLLKEERTVVFYEAPHRILALLDSIADVLGSYRSIVVARELTKLYESIYRGTVGDAKAHLESHPEAIRGEFVVVLEGGRNSTSNSELEDVLRILLASVDLKIAIELCCKLTGSKRNLVYKLAIDLREKN